MRYLYAVLLCASALPCAAAEPSKLFDEINNVDAKFFAAFNACDLKTMGNMFSKDLEFYHDLGGVNGYKGTMAATRSNCDRGGLTRKLVKGSLQVYPIRRYGAIEAGKHTFCHVENGKDDCGTFEFVHIWKRTDAGWRLTRVISYGH